MNIIITGAGKGIGFETVKAFSKDSNNNIIAISRNIDHLKKLEILGENTFLFPISYDLSDINIDLKEKISSHFNKIDILINNAGLLINKPFEDLTDNDFDQMFNINVKSVFKLINLLLPFFQPESHIVNISSMGGFQGSAKFKGLSLYSAAKGALNILTECLAEEFNEVGVKVNSLALGSVNTEMLQQAFPGYKAAIQPQEMALFIKNFAETAHNYLNGKIIPVSLTTP